MKALILAAGMGQRLRPYTRNRPKCLLRFAGESLLRRQIRTLRGCGISDVSIVAGYRADRIRERGVRWFENRNYARSNVIASLLCAAAVFDGGEDVIVAYGDIIYEAGVIERLAGAPPGDIVSAADEDWLVYYDERFGAGHRIEPGLVVDACGRVVDLARPAEAQQGERGVQYMGLVRFSVRGFAALQAVCGEAARDGVGPLTRGRSIEEATMTGIFVALLERGVPIQAATVRRGWLEFDSVRDYEMACRWYEEGSLERFIRLTPER